MSERYIYLLSSESEWNWHYYKIGHSSNPDIRLKDLQSGCPVKLFVMKKRKVSDPKKVEKELHKLFDYARKNGEWFKLTTEELLQLLAEFDKL